MGKIIDLALWAIMALCISALVLTAQASNNLAIKKDYPLTKLTNNVYVIHGPEEDVTPENQGFRNNPVIVQTDKGVVVVDPGSSRYSGEMVVNKVKSLTDKPIIAVFDTHGHGDHWLGNHGIQLHYPDVVIFGHQNMINAIANGDGDMWVDAINKRSEGAIEGTKPIAPTTAVVDGQEINFGNITFRVYHSGNAHSNNDIMLEVVEEKVFIFGDVLRDNVLGPFMSSFSGNLTALAIGEKTNAKVFIPGHGQSGNQSIINPYRYFITSLKDEVKKYYDQGMTDFEMKPKVINALSKYKSWSGFDENIGRLINLAYLEVENEAF